MTRQSVADGSKGGGGEGDGDTLTPQVDDDGSCSLDLDADVFEVLVDIATEDTTRSGVIPQFTIP